MDSNIFFPLLAKFKIEVEDCGSLTEEDYHYLLTNRIRHLLDLESGLLFSTMYRLDVLEYKIKEVLAGHSGEEIAAGLARLVLDRQREKVRTHGNLHGEPDFGDL